MTEPRLLHLLGASTWRMPTVRAAKALGLRVLVTDIFEDRPAYVLADERAVCDISNLTRTLEVARQFRIDGILCDTTDVGVPTAAYVAESMGLPGIGYQTARNFTDKARMRECLHGADIDSVRFERVQTGAELDVAIARLGGTAVVKPVDNQSGRGVSIVRDASCHAAALERALRSSRSGTAIVEEYVQGNEIIVDGFAVDGAVQILAVADKLPYADNPTISHRILYRSGDEYARIAERIQATVQAVLATMGLRNGIFHAEFILSGARIVPIDIAARGGGVMIYDQVLRHVCGVDVIEAMIRLAMGERVAIEPRPLRRGACIEFLRLPQGVLQEIQGVEAASALPGVAAVHLNVSPGNTIGPLQQKDDRPGFVVALAETSDAALRMAIQAKRSMRAVMASSAEPVPFNDLETTT